jgi:hypothetical protein
VSDWQDVMWRDESDATQLSQRLNVGPRELIEAIGGPWHVVGRAPEDEITRPGTLFVGRAGPSVAILVSDQPVPQVSVGVAVGRWRDPGTLEWSIGEPTGEVCAVASHASDREVAAMLTSLGQAVDEAFATKRPSLVICRYCGNLVAPEHALGSDICHACGSLVHGIVY